MGFRINTNIGALNAHANSVVNSNELDKSLSRLSSGLRINSAADDASGMAIADSLRSQAATLGQAINNGNDAIGILQTADKAMDEQLKILDTIKTKATQAAQDGQSLKTRTMLQADINRLMEELDNIANTTSFNGKQLLSGNFTNQEFQIGASSNQTIKATIGATQSSKIGVTRFETGARIYNIKYLYPNIFYIITEIIKLNLFAVFLVKQHLSYKLGKRIVQTKSILDIIELPLDLKNIVDSHKRNQLIPYNIKIENCLDYGEALKIKNYFSYKLGLILIKAHKNWYKGGYIKFWFDLYKLKKEYKNKKGK